ncbi:helix-turn-helix transcriptional regulator [Actinomadura graeca]|uniref:Helix-turn-helix transcriptional regulator n=1 Tax=Actinomadura graeca TaxID=2750812 RepID=A0ABX8QSH8_9ACTN|nr:helix-turn-helix transcriptional regulator [Actinomadura graeca]QXJ20707.1 helix-turn-helix transcriptional regulator [Actinomadura graeca]
MSPDKKAVGARLREVREAPPYWSRAELARLLRAAADPRDRVNMPHVPSLVTMIKQWESGKWLPNPRYRVLYARVTGLSEDELFGAAREPAAEVVPLLADHTPLNGRPADSGFVESIRESSQALVRLDAVHGADDILNLALRVFHRAHHKLATGAYTAAIERDFMAAAGEAGEVAAWLAYDADEQDVSRHAIQEALLLSRQAGDRDMELFELTHLAMQAVHLHRPGEALRITTSLFDGDLSPRVTALLNIRKGRALAQLGRGGEALDTLGRARAALLDGVTGRDSSWTWWITDSEVLWHTGMAHADLGDWPAAVPLLRESADLRVGFRRAHYNDQVHLLNALAHVGDWREAESVLTEVAGILGEVGSARTTNLLRRLTRRIVNADPPSTVADLARTVHLSLTGEDGGTGLALR